MQVISITIPKNLILKIFWCTGTKIRQIAMWYSVFETNLFKSKVKLLFIQFDEKQTWLAVFKIVKRAPILLKFFYLALKKVKNYIAAEWHWVIWPWWLYPKAQINTLIISIELYTYHEHACYSICSRLLDVHPGLGGNWTCLLTTTPCYWLLFFVEIV
jgi:hypothetical protein